MLTKYLHSESKKFTNQTGNILILGLVIIAIAALAAGIYFYKQKLTIFAPPAQVENSASSDPRLNNLDQDLYNLDESLRNVDRSLNDKMPVLNL